MGHVWNVQDCKNCLETRDVSYEDHPKVPDFGYTFSTYLEPYKIYHDNGLVLYRYSYSSIEEKDPEYECMAKYRDLIKDFGFVLVYSDEDGTYAYETAAGDIMFIAINDAFFAVSVVIE